MGMRTPNHSRSSFQECFRFSDNNFESLGQITVPLSTPFGIATIYVQSVVVQTNIPVILGMHILCTESPSADTVSNRLTKRMGVDHKDGTSSYIDEWCVPLYRAHSN